ncbi:hypothetical protein GCM10027411_19380 [Microbacterium aureliae]
MRVMLQCVYLYVATDIHVVAERKSAPTVQEGVVSHYAVVADGYALRFEEHCPPVNCGPAADSHPGDPIREEPELMPRNATANKQGEEYETSPVVAKMESLQNRTVHV